MGINMHDPDVYQRAIDEIYEQTKRLDCGDQSCLFAKDKSGQRTNGGCRCEPARVLDDADQEVKGIEISVDDLTKYEKHCGTVGDKMFKQEHVDFLKSHGIEKVYLGVSTGIDPIDGSYADDEGLVSTAIIQLDHTLTDEEDENTVAEEFEALAGIRADNCPQLGPGWAWFESE